MLDRLIHKEWSTDYSSVTDENGCFVLSGFKGEYKVDVDGKCFCVSNCEAQPKELHITIA